MTEPKKDNTPEKIVVFAADRIGTHTVHVHFDSDHAEGRIVGDGTVADAQGRRFLIEVTAAVTHIIAVGDRIWIPEADCVTTKRVLNVITGQGSVFQ